MASLGFVSFNQDIPDRFKKSLPEPERRKPLENRTNKIYTERYSQRVRPSRRSNIAPKSILSSAGNNSIMASHFSKISQKVKKAVKNDVENRDNSFSPPIRRTKRTTAQALPPAWEKEKMNEIAEVENELAAMRNRKPVCPANWGYETIIVVEQVEREIRAMRDRAFPSDILIV